MPELPDITLYIEALEKRVLGQSVQRFRLMSPFLLRTATPPIDAITGRKVVTLRRIGKRLALGFEDELWLVLHLMIAGRLHWLEAKPVTTKSTRTGAKQAEFVFATGSLVLTEAGTKRRASIHVVQGEAALKSLDPGGLEVLDCSSDEFIARLTSQNHTLKRALTDPRLFSGIGNAYSDEILHRAKLSPVALTQKLHGDASVRLFHATQNCLREWTERLREETGEGFPEGVTAFRPEMAVHGKYGKPCPVCGSPVQRIRYADNETNYCPQCQTGGKLLADRSLSLLLKKDWPKTQEELEEMKTELSRRSPLARDGG